MKTTMLTEYCEVFGISRQAHHKAFQATLSRGEFERTVIDATNEIRATQPKVGTKKLKVHLKRDYNILIGRDTLYRLLSEYRMLITKKRHGMKTTDSRHCLEKHSNKIKEMTIDRPEQVFVSDITYIRVSQVFMYLFLVTDIYSKQIMGYCLGSTMHRENALKALKDAIGRKIYKETETIHHSDCGSQYCSSEYIEQLKRNKIKVSMTEENHCYENCVAERVNGILKSELGLEETMASERDAHYKIKKAINIYNTKRLHLSCEMLTPEEAHKKGGPLKKMWSKRNYKLWVGEQNVDAINAK